jgi:outer membrane receptor for ferrienterochelin and colicins
MKTKILIIFIFQIIFAVNLFSQHVHGRILSYDENKNTVPLVGANVYWAHINDGTSTNAEGEFHIDLPENTEPLLVISYVGFISDTLTISDDEGYIEHILTENPNLKGVEVKEKQNDSFISRIETIQTQIITDEEFKKAACCNLSESFETNASVDVSYSDAVSGAKQILLLGLSGKYSQLMTENFPNLRGLASTYGLGYIPGSWMESIQISKGTASVTNGYESTTGQINVEQKKPDNGEKFYLNLLGNSFGKVEGNTNASIVINKHWSTAVFAHVENMTQRHDNNNDNFMDEPLIKQVNLFNRWKYNSHKNLMGQVGIKFLDEERTGGQMNYEPSQDIGPDNAYGIKIKTKRYEIFAKSGYIMPNMDETSFGFINSLTYHDQISDFGYNEYSGKELNWNSNLIFQSIMGNTRHSYSTGVSFMYDDYDESLNDSAFSRKEIVPGVFYQYTYSNMHNLTILLGVRADFHNIYGTFYTPRIHFKHNLNESTILRASAGKGYRTANVIAENSSILASSRMLIIKDEPKQEEAWNYGVNLSKFIDILGRELTINLDYYRTDFRNQIVIDRDQDVYSVYVYNLDGKSYSNSFQIEVIYELIPRLDFLAAFRYNDVKITTNGMLQEKPLLNKYKGLLNLSYSTADTEKKWQFDFTAQFNGDARIPGTEGYPAEYRRPESAPAFTIINFQISKYFKRLELYAGGENLTDFTQSDPIIAADDPFGDYFDSSMIWGPIVGRKFYVGMKFTIN